MNPSSHLKSSPSSSEYSQNFVYGQREHIHNARANRAQASNNQIRANIAKIGENVIGNAAEAAGILGLAFFLYKTFQWLKSDSEGELNAVPGVNGDDDIQDPNRQDNIQKNELLSPITEAVKKIAARVQKPTEKLLNAAKRSFDAACEAGARKVEEKLTKPLAALQAIVDLSKLLQDQGEEKSNAPL